jgi:hypothetical protein
LNATGPARPGLRFHAGYCVLAAVLLLPVLCIVGVTSYFRLGSETTALRESLMSSVTGSWHKTIALNVGWFTTTLVRAGAGWFSLPAEPRAALAAVHGAEVGVYELDQDAGQIDHARVLRQADKAMAARGWERVVGVAQERNLVAIYLPRRGFSLKNVKCCLLVFQGRELVVASVRGNPKPLLQLATDRLDLSHKMPALALR